MKTLEVIYKYGHFYDKKTGRRLIVKDETELAIVLPDNNQLLEHDPLNLPQRPREAAELEEQMRGLKGFKRFKKILNKGANLSFVITSAIMTSDVTKRYTIEFGLILMEDLYIYETTKVLLSQSYCVVDKVLKGHLPYFEPMHAYSLNEAHHKTFVHFFNKRGHGTANAFDKYFLPNGQPLSTLRKF